MANIKVAVRVRPISIREVSLTGSEVVVRRDSNGISLTNLKVSSSKAGDSRERTRRYGFDYCFDSSNPEAEDFADQARIYETLGQSVLDAVFSGYNSCIVAYGQSASGKTYTMMGTKEDPGLTPRLCEGLFSRIDGEKGNERTYRVSVSYLEIYNERVRDLLKPSSSKSGLRVREHPRLGPYVQGLTHHVVHTLGSLMSYVEEGTKARKTASTLQNPSSSRSHALLTIAVTPETSGVAVGAGSSASGSTRRKEPAPRGGSKLRLVDLAGSESAATCSGVHRLKEGANINKSLVALGNVISALAERGSTGSGPGRRFIPYRDSSLTWLLKDALGGNATTIMLAMISPASGSYNETAHTLRFAQRAQSVVNRPVVNEDPVARIIRELRAEVARLKFLLLEKNVESNDKALCSCRRIQSAAQPGDTVETNSTEEVEDVSTGRLKGRDTEGSQEDQEEGKLDEGRSFKGVVAFRRSNSSDSLTTAEAEASVKRFGSCEFLGPRDRLAGYKRAKVTELNEEEDQVGEIHESVFVDIPTLVAVLIKPDDSLQETSAQIEEICSDEVVEDAIDDEFIEPGNDRDAFEDAEKQESLDNDERSSSVSSCHVSGDNETDVYQRDCSRSSSRLKEKPKFRKQDSVDVLSPSIASNLYTSRRFGSVEAIQRKREPLFPLERSHTNLEKRSTVSDRAKKLNNIREIDDQKLGGRSLWGKEQLQRKSSNDSDRSVKDNQAGTKAKNYARKPSLENLKRKTSKDSSSSSSKDEQILISSLTRDKLLSRKNSFEQEPQQTRAHTPIQRVKRAEIVAAVTERLYSSRKAAEDASGIRSPPEVTDVKCMARMKLQEISRKMLGKRRRVCVDTQTDSARTVRMKDTACLTETVEVICQDVGVLTDEHQDCELMSPRKTPILRVKEIATSTDKPRTNIVRYKDVGSSATDLEEFEYEIHSPRNDSGILSDDTQNYAESNLSSTEVSDLCPEGDRRAMHAESSTNTLFSSRSFAVQTPRFDTLNHRIAENKAPICSRQCCNSVQEPQNHLPVGNPEKSIISISLPDTISITIESTNVLESRIAVMESVDQEKLRANTRDGEVQTEEVLSKDLRNESLCSKEFTRSTLSQTDSRVFRIENIFQDPNNAAKCSKVDVGGADRMEGSRIRNSITFRNSLGTSYVAKEGEASWDAGLRGEGFIRDGLITEAFITRKRGFNFKRPSAVVYDNSWRNWSVSGPVNAVRSANNVKRLEVIPSTWSSEIPVACNNCSVVVDPGGKSRQVDVEGTIGTTEMKSSSSGALEMNNNVDHDHSFSDDSLDYNENNLLNQTTALKVDDLDQREGLCPPDVVAHTKKDCLKPSTLDTENTEALGDFDDNYVEFPKKKPTESMETQITDYKSLILGGSHNFVDLEEEAEDSMNRVSSFPGKKKVSFSSSQITEKRIEQRESDSKQDSKSTLKSIIKKRKKRSPESLSVVHSSNEETDNSQQGEGSFVPRSDRREAQSSSEETSREDQDLDSRRDAKQNRKKVKFFVEDRSRLYSESDSCENVEDDDEEDVPFDRATRNILEEYLIEAVTFMRNLNSINEYVNVTSMLERCSASTRSGRGRRGTRRRSGSTWNRDHAESASRRVGRRDADDYLQEDDDIVSTESYQRCLRGIQRLEDCIHRVDRHNDLLREKYGVDCESAGARLGLASPSTDPRAPVADDFSVSLGTDVPYVGAERSSDSRVLDASSESRIDKDDLEKRIFDQLMNVANSARYRNSSRVQSRFSRSSDLESRSSTTYSKFREKHFTKEPLHRDVCASFNLDESLDGKEDQDFTRYEITGNLSVARSSSRQGDILDNLDWTIEDDILPLTRVDRITDATSAERRLSGASGRTNGCAGSPDIFSRRGNVGPGIVDDDAPGKTGSRTSLAMQRVLTDDARERLRELDDYSRKLRESSKMADIGAGSEILHCRDKLKYPGSPRARFLELLRERRRIVESSRGTSAS